MAEPLRIANASGFYGDRASATREMVEGGPVDVVTGDYLAELTMGILWKARQKDPDAGYAATYPSQVEEVLGRVAASGTRLVSNAGGLNPRSLADRLRAKVAERGAALTVAHVEGDDLTGRLDELRSAGEPLRHLETGRSFAESALEPLAAHAYLGGWGIAAALGRGADVVVAPRVADAALVVGPAAWRFGWARDDWDVLAGATVAGHVLECGTHATGGNYAFFEEVADLRRPGFPLAEVHADGSVVVTKHPGTGGEVSVGTVTAQLLYEIDGARYLTPDVVARFDTVRIAAEGPDRVRIWGARGEPPPPTLKVGIVGLAGYRNSMTLVITGEAVEAKARAAEDALRYALGPDGPVLETRLLRLDKRDAPTHEEASAFLVVTARHPDPARVGRRFSSAVVELALASYPGLYATAPPGGESPALVFFPTRVERRHVVERVHLAEGEPVVVAPPPTAPLPREPAASPPAPLAAGGPTRRVPLGSLVGARSGDKGGNANVGFWARSPEAYAWLDAFLTVERFRSLLAEAQPLEVRRSALPNLLAVNFVVVGLLGDGAGSSSRLDAQAKSLGEYLRSRLVDVPEALLAAGPA